MSDLKSKLPDLKEVTGMLGKLFSDVKKSIVEIAGDYKEKHKETPQTEEKTAEPAKPTEAPKAEAPKDEAPKDEAPKDEAPKDE